MIWLHLHESVAASIVPQSYTMASRKVNRNRRPLYGKKRQEVDSGSKYLGVQALGSEQHRVPAICEAMTTQLYLFSATLTQTKEHLEVNLARVQMQFHDDETKWGPTLVFPQERSLPMARSTEAVWRNPQARLLNLRW